MSEGQVSDKGGDQKCCNSRAEGQQEIGKPESLTGIRIFADGAGTLQQPDLHFSILSRDLTLPEDEAKQLLSILLVSTTGEGCQPLSRELCAKFIEPLQDLDRVRSNAGRGRETCCFLPTNRIPDTYSYAQVFEALRKLKAGTIVLRFSQSRRVFVQPADCQETIRLATDLEQTLLSHPLQLCDEQPEPAVGSRVGWLFTRPTVQFLSIVVLDLEPLTS